MIVGHINQLEAKQISHTEAKNAFMKILISPQEGWEGHVMRVLEVEVNGYTPKHSHPWPHINYMIEGKGQLMMNGEIHQVEAGTFAYVPGGTLHQFKNIGNEIFKFICIVPEEGHK
jgi:quercetin dioxygenase-like cupin family protein